MHLNEVHVVSSANMFSPHFGDAKLHSKLQENEAIAAPTQRWRKGKIANEQLAAAFVCLIALLHSYGLSQVQTLLRRADTTLMRPERYGSQAHGMCCRI